jgi:hypothetical protein
MTSSVQRTKKARLIALLRDRRYHSSRELMKAGGYRFSARLNELKNQGFAFSLKRDGRDQNLFWYRLASKPIAA